MRSILAYSAKCDACFRNCNFWRFRIRSWCEQESDSTDSIEDHVSIEDSRSSELTLILSGIHSNINQNGCVLVNVLRLNAIMLENIDRLSEIVLQSIKYLKIGSDSINWVKTITRIVWSRSRQAICCRLIAITKVVVCESFNELSINLLIVLLLMSLVIATYFVDRQRYCCKEWVYY